MSKVGSPLHHNLEKIHDLVDGNTKILISFVHVLHSDIVVWFFLSELKSCIKLKFVTVSIADC